MPEAGEAPAASPAITEDRFLGGRLLIRQPAQGYRVGIDPAFLAAAASLARGKVLDLGCGVGAAGLCLARRQPALSIVGLELQPALADLARQNVVLNGFADRMRIETGDLLRPPSKVALASFDLVLANPPFHASGRATAPKEAGRAAGHVEGQADLAAWIERSLGFARDRGLLLMIHKPERLEEILAALAGRAGAIVVFPLLAGAGKPASRVLVRAEKGSEAPLSRRSGLVLHEADGRYTDAAEAILRRGEALVL